MSKPTAVIISDVHYSMQTLEVADKAMRLAVAKSNELGVPLVVCGDLHDSKANIRAECMNTMTKTFELCKQHSIILRGNHCSVNEKSEEHALGFLSRTSQIVSTIGKFRNWCFIAYQHDPMEFSLALARIPKGSTIFCHQGVMGSNAGHYIQDKSAVPIEWIKGYRVISGHYHNRQTLHSYGSIPPGMSVNGPRGLWDYVGNPYTLNFAEANDPEKGFQILYEDGSLEFVPTNLRKHIIINIEYTNSAVFTISKYAPIKEKDIIWVKVTGPSDEVCNLTHKSIAKVFNFTHDFKLDLIPLEVTPGEKLEVNESITQVQMLDTLIDNLTNTDNTRKLRLKELWKRLN